MPSLNWIGKDAVRSHHQEVPFRLLREDPDRGVGDPDADNLLVQGDNLVALKALLPYYAGQVKCVYIDPPYNTGNEGWAYNDNVNSPQMRRWLGETVGKEAEDLSRHDKWLCMMYPRVMLLHELLATDGSFWMSIDDNEVHHARALLDEIFGRKNFVACITWQRAYSPRMDSSGFSRDTDYVLVYGRSEDFAVEQISFEQNASQFTHVDPSNGRKYRRRSLQKKGKNSLREDRPNLFYAVKAPDGTEVYPIRSDGRDGTWRWKSERYEKASQEDLTEWVNDEGDWKVYVKQFLDKEASRPPSTLWLHEEAGHNHEASEEIKEILSGNAFSSPKPTRLIQRILEIATDPGDLVLDSFAGSGTTGHAVLKKNAADGYDRRFILVELEEDVAENVTLQRLKRATEGYEYEGTEKTTLMERSIGVRDLKKGAEIYEESEAIKQKHDNDFDKIRRSMDDGVFTLTGETNVTDRKDGLGSGMRYATLGPVLMDANGTVRRDVAYDDLARHIHYAETGAPLPADADMDPPLVSQHDGMAIYLLYNGVLGDARPEGGNVLTRSVLNDLPTNGTSGPKIVYGVACRVSETACNQHGVIFRQIPYDVRAA